MPVGYPPEVWAQVLVKIETRHFDRTVEAAYGLALKQHYLGRWYIKRVEKLLREPSWGGGSPPDPYSLFIAVKAESGAVMVEALAEIRRELSNASRIDVYQVDDLRFRANW